MNQRRFHVLTRPPGATTNTFRNAPQRHREALRRCCCIRLTHLQQPALAVRVEEGQSKVVAVVLGDLEGFAADAGVKFLEEKTEAKSKKSFIVL